MSIKIKITSPIDGEILLRQLDHKNKNLDAYEFIFTDQDIECDWWVVMHGSSIKHSETARTDPDHIIFLSMEPTCFGFPLDFVNQFSLTVSPKPYANINNLSFNVSTWWVGKEVSLADDAHQFSAKNLMNFRDLADNQFTNKEKFMSVICSRKNFLKGHRARLGFIDKLKRSDLAKYIDFFGGDDLPLVDKIEALASYKYHLVIENNSEKNYWSEKLADTFLANSIPVYYGCTNVDDFFPVGSIVNIDIMDEFKSFEKIKELLADSRYYELHKDLIQQSKRKILDDYNFFAILSKICDSKAVAKCSNTVYSPSEFKRSRLVSFLDKQKSLIQTHFSSIT